MARKERHEIDIMKKLYVDVPIKNCIFHFEGMDYECITFFSELSTLSLPSEGY
jgi:hypothetical protein